MLLDRPDHKDHLEFLVIGDLATEGVFDRAVEGVDAIIHTASVCCPHYFSLWCVVMIS